MERLEPWKWKRKRREEETKTCSVPAGKDDAQLAGRPHRRTRPHSPRGPGKGRPGLRSLEQEGTQHATNRQQLKAGKEMHLEGHERPDGKEGKEGERHEGKERGEAEENGRIEKRAHRVALDST